MPSHHDVRHDDNFAATLVEFRRTLHQHPELSLHEVETTNRIREFLHLLSVEIVPTNLKTGLCAVVRGNRPGACVAIRADIDALPIAEQTGLPFASVSEGKMHACGHDFHTAAVLGAVIRATQRAASNESFPGEILFVFQPAEEVGQGAKQVLESGVLEQLKVGAIFGEHNQPLLPAGTIGVAQGPLMASVDEFRIVVRGVGGHAALPEQAVDPILTAAHIVAGLQHIVSRTIAPMGAVVVTVGSFHAGTANNIIPPEAILDGTVRCLQPQYRDCVEQRLHSFVEQTARAFGAAAEVTYRRVLPGVVNDEGLTELVRSCAARVVGETSVAYASPSMAGEDFSLYQERIPGCFFWIGTGKPDGSSKAWHHPQFDVDESMLSVTAEVFVESAVEWLCAHS